MEIKISVKGKSAEVNEAIQDVENAKTAYLNALKRLHDVVAHNDVISISTKE